MEHTLLTSIAAMYVQGSSSQTNIELGSSSNSHFADGFSSATVGTIQPGSFYPAPIVHNPPSLHMPSVQQHPLLMLPPVQFSPYGYGYGFVGTSEFGFSAGPIPSSSNMTTMNAHVVAPYPIGDAWIVDTGTSHHMTSDVSNLSQPTPFDGSDQIKIGNGQGQGNKGDTIQRQE
ncbi:uncharacterized protein LOC103967421 [Pyrus x bretschneideri]|uniref:uncharacterized protein LOC103967421 n=1 Tax=Pyrus x bretschneideri TaxID=225117 RepID=UPI00203097F1|nr:uncharacterized protein LOC103967421 [Pyrus x bretschneideri]